MPKNDLNVTLQPYLIKYTSTHEYANCPIFKVL